jgi:hypothetical protein
MVILGEHNGWFFHKTARMHGGNVQLVSTLSMKTTTRENGSHIYTTIVE